MKPWSIDWTTAIESDSVQSGLTGRLEQRRHTRRRSIIVSASRILYGVELIRWEKIARIDTCYGQKSFRDIYELRGQQKNGEMRLVDGAYSYVTDGRNHVVSCELELIDAAIS